MILRNKRILILGSSQGIGKATWDRLKEEKAWVIAGDLAPSKGAWKVDASNPASIRSFVYRASQDLSKIDGLVYVAGVQRASSITDISEQDISDMLSVNLLGAIHFIREAVPYLAEDASVVVVASIAGLVGGGPGLAAYAATKGAAIALTKALATELAPIRVNVVCPGWTNTRFNTPVLDYAKNNNIPLDPSDTLLGRQAHPEEIAGPIVFLLSRDASYMTGHCLIVDGGLTLR